MTSTLYGNASTNVLYQNEKFVPVHFISLHGGPATHFCAFSEALGKKGYTVTIWATEPAMKVCQARKIRASELNPNQVNLSSSDAVGVAQAVAEKLGDNLQIVITDVGHIFAKSLHMAFAAYTPKVIHLAYYDNPEQDVPGGYNETAVAVMTQANGILFANANLSTIFNRQLNRTCWRVGYYPLEQASELENRRNNERIGLREKLLKEMSYLTTQEMQGRKVAVYLGGNNPEYFDEAFPAFMKMVQESAEDYNNYIFIVQQHPGAKKENKDGKLLKEFLKTGKALPIFISGWDVSADMIVAADVVLYYQTSMGPQLALSNIPTIQIGHKIYNDILVRKGISPSVTTSIGLKEALITMERPTDLNRFDRCLKLFEELGVSSQWPDKLHTTLQFYIDNPVIIPRKEEKTGKVKQMSKSVDF